MILDRNTKLNELQISLLKSISIIKKTEDVKELQSLINFYLRKKLDDSIEKVENEKNYSQNTYEEWLRLANVNK
jgi:hypothetical protein